jgi:DNA-binding response OmpR family regulator
MKPLALVIDDDPDIIDSVQEYLALLRHDFDSVCCVEDAQKQIEIKRYDYVLLDLNLPLYPQRGLQRIENGISLLDDILNCKMQAGVPVIVITAHGNDGPLQAVELMKRGAADYVPKPFQSTGKTLDSTIREALAKSKRVAQPGSEPPAPEVKPAAAKNDMIFYPDRVELWGVRIADEVNSSQERRILDILRTQARGGAALAKMLGPNTTQNSVSQCINRFRQKLKARFTDTSRCSCDPAAVIETTRNGFRINPAIRIVDAMSGVENAA